MRKILFYTLILGLLAACKQPAEPSAQDLSLQNPATASVATAESDPVLAQVGTETITKPQFDRLLDTLDAQDRQFAQTPVGARNFLQLLIREKLVLLDAKEKGLDKSELYLDDLEQKRQQLQEIYNNYAQQLLLRMWDEQNYAQGRLKVTDEEIEAYFKKYPYEMTIKQIILADAQTAETIWKELKYNKNRWKELEKRYSISPQYSHGQSFSFMPGEFIAELEVIAANSPTGSVQGFVKTPQGFHIIMKTGERRLSLKEAAPRIRAILENQKTDELIEALQNKYKVVIYEQND